MHSDYNVHSKKVIGWFGSAFSSLSHYCLGIKFSSLEYRYVTCTYMCMHTHTLRTHAGVQKYNDYYVACIYDSVPQSDNPLSKVHAQLVWRL